MHVVAPKEASTCRSKGPKGEWIERTYDFFCVSQLQEKFSQVKVVEDVGSRPYKAVSFVVEREKEVQEWNDQTMPKALLGCSGGRQPGRSAEEAGREEEEEKEESGDKRNQE